MIKCNHERRFLFYHMKKHVIICPGDYMRRLGLCILIGLLLVGCSTNQTLESQQFNRYDEIIDKVENQQAFQTSYQYHVSLVYNLIEKQYRYDVIIDQPQIDMYDIQVLCYINDSDDILPSLGIFDEDQYHLKQKYVNKDNGFYKGIHLSGYSPKKQSIKLYIAYYKDEKKTKRIENYIEVHP